MSSNVGTQPFVAEEMDEEEEVAPYASLVGMRSKLGTIELANSEYKVVIV